MEKGITNYETLGNHIAKETGFSYEDSMVTNYERDSHYNIQFSSGDLMELNPTGFCNMIQDYFKKYNIKTSITSFNDSKIKDFSITIKIEDKTKLNLNANFMRFADADLLEVKVRESR